MSERERISIIIPFYNTKKELIQKALLSAVNQTYKNIEILIVNDGSDSEHTRIVEELARTDDRIVLINQNNFGVSHARNAGIDAASGEFVAFLDADDELSPVFLEKAIQLMEAEKAELIIGGCQRVRDWSQKAYPSNTNFDVYESPETIKVHLISNADLIRFEGGYIGRGCWARLIKKTLLEKCRFDERIMIGEDIIWNLHLLNMVDKVIIAKTVWYYYYVNSEGATNRYDNGIYNKLTDELCSLRALVDDTNESEFIAYRNHIIEEIRKVCNSYLCHRNSLKEKRKRKETIRNMYSEPWSLILDEKYKSNVERRTRVFITLYKSRVLFLMKLFYNSVKGR